MLPPHDLRDVPLFFGRLNQPLCLIKHRQAGMGENVLAVDFDELFRHLDRFVIASAIKEGHTQPVQDVLIVRINLQGLAVKFDGFVELIVSKSLYGLLKNLFLCHDESIAIEFRPIMENITTSNRRPALLVLQEWWGLNDHIKDISRRLESEGFVTLPVDMYDGKVTKDPEEARRLMMAMDRAAAMEKLNGAVRQLQADPRVSSVGVIGFCMGGFLSLSLACNNRDIQAAVAFYGSVPPDAMLGKLSAPILYIYGEKDHHIPASEIDRLERLTQTAGKPAEVVRYPDSDHAFFNDTRKEVYNPKDAKDAWTRTLVFLSKNLK